VQVEVLKAVYQLQGLVGTSIGHEENVDMSTLPQPLDIKFEVQQSLFLITFLWGSKAEAFAGSAIEFAGEGVAVVLGEVGHALAFGEVLAQ